MAAGPDPAVVRSIDSFVAQGEARVRDRAGEAPRRKRGRPRKHPLPAGAQAPAASSGSGPAPSAQPTLEEQQTAAGAPLQPTLLADHRPLVRDLVTGYSGLIVEVTGCKDLAVSDAQKNDLAEGLSPLLQKYFPDLSGGEMGPEVRAIISVGMFGFSQYLIYREWKKAQAAKPVEPGPAAA
jgi:hypothetical protein